MPSRSQIGKHFAGRSQRRKSQFYLTSKLSSKIVIISFEKILYFQIADFGLSNVFDNTSRRLLSTFCGSPLYASPEIVRGTPYIGPEVDCWLVQFSYSVTVVSSLISRFNHLTTCVGLWVCCSIRSFTERCPLTGPISSGSSNRFPLEIIMNRRRNLQVA